VYSNTGGQACTSGFTGQVADMSAYGKAQHGKTEARKELALIAIAHRGVYVHQSSQASASHLMAGVLKGLRKRCPVLLNIYTPCPVEHGLPDDWGQQAARLALESRAFPYLSYDPDAGPALSDCLSLEGNPSPDTPWPSYTLKFESADGPGTLDLPLTIADWAATEARFKQHFKELPPEEADDTLLPFHEFLAAGADAREGRTPFIYAVGKDHRLRRLLVAPEIVRLAEERQEFWSLLRQLAGLEVAPAVREGIAGELEAEYQRKAEALRSEFEARYKALELDTPRRMARRLAEGLLRTSGGSAAVVELLASLPHGNHPPTAPLAPTPLIQAATAAPATPAAASAEPIPSPASQASVVAEPLGLEAYIDSVRCTSCNECTNLNGRMFAYNADKQAQIKDASAGTFQQLVLAAERCPVGIIYPGTPLNPKEKDLAKWLKRAERFK
jgi:pyruvate-ferredoxin/flavodoxin oxidoreductase